MTSFEPMTDEEWAEFRDFDANYESFPADAPTMPAGLVVGWREHRAMSRPVPMPLSGCTCGGIGDTGSHFAGCPWSTQGAVPGFSAHAQAGVEAIKEASK